MTDAKYVFNQTSRERKSAGTGAFHKKGGSKSKRCTLPSDHLTPSQLKKRSSAVMTYNISKPMTYAEFKRLDDNAKRFYLEAIIQKYRPRVVDLAEMFGCSHGTLTTILKKYPSAKAMLNKDRINNGMSKEWAAFIAPATPDPAPDCVKTSGDSNDTPGGAGHYYREGHYTDQLAVHAITRDMLQSYPMKAPAPTPAISGSFTLDGTVEQLTTILCKLFSNDSTHHFTVSFE